MPCGQATCPACSTCGMRGSAAKPEICYRALHASHGLDCPLWRPGISADIEAMLRTEDEWLRDYPSLTRNPTQSDTAQP